MADAPRYDLFLSHATPDKHWVRTLDAELRALGLDVFLDEVEIRPGESFVLSLSEALDASRFLVLVLSPHSAGRPWVDQEWTAFLARHGPTGRVLPVVVDDVETPAILAPVHRLDARHRDAARAAREIASIVGRPGELAADDARRLVLGQHLIFTVAFSGEDGDELAVTGPDGVVRTVTPPWRTDDAARFAAAGLIFRDQTQRAVTTASERAELTRAAGVLGEALFAVLFDAAARGHLERATIPGLPPPLLTLRSDSDVLLSLPWELLAAGGAFLVRDGRLDLARSTLTEVGPGALVPEPGDVLKLVVNVSAPEDSGLDWEGESYRITRALTASCELTPTELGTVDDLIETARRVKPSAVHFSGHGLPGRLQFEDDEGRSDVVKVAELVARLRRELDGELPPFFYLASCHGNEPWVPEDEKSGAESSAAHLHRAGVAEVVGYYGPIADELSTRAEEALYGALAAGETARRALRRAREALGRPFAGRAGHRPGRGPEAAATPAVEATASEAEIAAVTTHPFAWAQLVFYHRGPERPLCRALPEAQRRERATVLERSFRGLGKRKVLQTGFIGRRTELHRVRQRLKRGDRVFVFQGLGGLGKSTLAFEVLPRLGAEESDVAVLWCQETESRPDRAAALVDQLLEYCRGRFGAGWEQVVFQVDRMAGDDPAKRFLLFLDAATENLPRLVVYLDNLESLLVGPDDVRASRDEGAMGEWRSPALASIWRSLVELARQRELRLVASCRYRHGDFAGTLLPVSPLPADALFRMMAWFPGLRRLAVDTRAKLVARLAGHPRAVEFADDLVAHALRTWEDERGEWRLGEPPSEAELAREWGELVAPALPRVQERLWEDLLLAQIWKRVLGERERRMLYRMSLLRRPWEADLHDVLGEPGEPAEQARETARRLRRTSLLEQVELWVAAPGAPQHPAPATVQFVGGRFAGDEALRRRAHRRVGEHLEAQLATRRYIETYVEAGHHLLEGGEADRSYELLGTASDWLRDHGRVREGLQILEPFLAAAVLEVLKPELECRLLGTVGLAYVNLGEVEKATGYCEEALVIAREIGDRLREGNLLGNLGLAHAALGELEKAIDHYQKALVIARETEYRLGEGNQLGNLGGAYFSLEKVEEAIGYYEKQVAISREIGDQRGEANGLTGLGISHAALSKVEKAIGYYEQALVIFRDLGDRRNEGMVLGNLGLAYGVMGSVVKAIDYGEMALVISREIADRRGEGSHLGNLGIAYARLGEVEKAIGYLEAALRLGEEIKDPQIVGIVSAQLEKLRGGPASA